jgi:selenocysteine lyase/cysteine desulfurase
MRGADWVTDDLYQPAPDAKRFESWEFAWALVLGAGAAARYTTALGLVPIRERVRSLSSRLRERLAEIPSVRVLDRGVELGATVTATVAGRVPADLVTALRLRGINTSSQSRIDAVIDYDDKGVDGALRVSPHYFNDDSDLDSLVEALTEIVAG